jgi:nitrate reductase NapD
MRHDVPEKSPIANIRRRDVLNGHLNGSAGSIAGLPIEIASILVQTWPERLDAAVRKIEAIPGTQVYSRDPKGKLVVVIEAARVGGIGSTLNTISMMREVLSAALVFHVTDEG